MHRIFGIIPARGGSKGILQKNIRSLAGKPLIGWTIEATLNSKVYRRHLVSTDIPEIAAVAREFGADVYSSNPLPFHPILRHRYPLLGMHWIG